MKKIFLSFAIFTFILFQISALEISTQKTEFYQGETFLANISGNILDEIKSENVGFYKNNVQLPITFDIKKINNIYYIYALLPYSEHNLSLIIKDVYFKENNQPQKKDLEKKFSIINKTADFSIVPGFFITQKEVSVVITNNLNNDIVISYTIDNIQGSESIPLQDKKTIKINTDNIEFTNLTFLTLSSDSGFSYSVPAYIIKSFIPNVNDSNFSEDENITPIYSNTEVLRFSYSEINTNLSKSDSVFYPITISNIGQKNASNIKISVSPEIKNYLSLSTEKINELKIGEDFQINLTAKFAKTGEFSGFITAESKNSSDKIKMNFIVGNNLTITSSVSDKKSCSQIGGKKCSICYGSSIPASDGLCCIGSCNPVVEPTKRNWTAIVIVVSFLVLIGIFFWFKWKKPSATAKDILEKRIKM